MRLGRFFHWPARSSAWSMVRLPGPDGWRKRIVGLEQHVPLLEAGSPLTSTSTTPPAHLTPGRARCDPASSTLLRERAPGRWIQVRLSTAAYDRRTHDRPLRRSRVEHQRSDFREEHDRSHQQTRLSLPARAAKRRLLDRDGAPFKRPTLARPCKVVRAKVRATAALTRTIRPPALGLRDRVAL